MRRESSTTRPRSGGLVVTQDALVEGVHFRFDLVSWRDLGFRAAAANISDLAASGAEPLALLVAFGAPGETQLEDVVELYEGLNEPGVPVRGGDTTRAGAVLLSVTALGRAERVPGRAGARPGDALVVTGPLGAAGAAFREGRLARPPIRVEEGKRLAGLRTRCSTSPTGSRSTRRTSPAARAAASSSSSNASRSPPVRCSRTPASARTTSCSPRRPIRSTSR